MPADVDPDDSDVEVENEIGKESSDRLGFPDSSQRDQTETGDRQSERSSVGSASDKNCCFVLVPVQDALVSARFACVFGVLLAR
jgi:hypothetical protein